MMAGVAIPRERVRRLCPCGVPMSDPRAIRSRGGSRRSGIERDVELVWHGLEER